MGARRASGTTTIGVISDTHGLMRPQALEALHGSDLILHAGDIGSPDVLATLQAIAPVTAVRGNNDRDRWAADLPVTTAVEVGGLWLYMIHDIGDLDIDPAESFAAVIAGHSHKPSAELRNGVLYFNPGSAGPRRFRLPISVGRLVIRDAHLDGQLIDLIDLTAA